MALKDRRGAPRLLVGRAMDNRHLGKASSLPASPEEAALDYVPNPRIGALYLVRFAAPEFTSLCPVTGQPDFAHLVIDYAPGETIVESKSLKLFLGAFRNHCGFHEDVTVGIGQRLAAEMKPKWLRIGGYWYPRGGLHRDRPAEPRRAARHHDHEALEIVPGHARLPCVWATS